MGTATASNNYFRQIGASIGTAVVGSLCVARLADLLSTRLPDAVREIIVGSYNDALAPVFLYMVPLVLLSAVLLAFVKEVPLATTIKHDEPADTLNVLGEDNTTVDADAESRELTTASDQSGAISIIRSQPSASRWRQFHRSPPPPF